ncbi:MAG: 16S rRNA (guanine(966)-N(2))-methyltransferase RsmD [Gammaproteobacteria bacterium 28-57-27]|nr:MAG: 16S rRNA (guanine(966)-N(2))-methyltransferase RsmD [Gammaproteobacteria bacterium 28-57-27]
MIRIIGGEHRSRQLKVLDRPGLRPTPDRVRETLFNWLAAHISGARVLDLFAGSGALGFEALSRGAAWCDFVEKDAAAARLLQENIELLRLSQRAQLKRQDALAFLKSTPQQPYDVVFLDPPYASDLLAQVLPLLKQAEWLSPSALIFIDQSSHHAPPALLESGELGWEKLRQGTAGEVSYSLYQATS